MTEKIKAELTAVLSNQSASIIIEVDKCDYDAAEDKEEFLQQIYEDHLSKLVATGYVILRFRMPSSDYLNREIDEIKAQGIEEAVKKADSETYINLVGKEFPPQQQYRAELLAYASSLKNNLRSL